MVDRKLLVLTLLSVVIFNVCLTNVSATLSGNVSIATGLYHTCIIFSNNQTAECWGNNDYGQTDVPPEIQGHIAHSDYIESIEAGEYNSCAMLDDYSFVCWGDNRHGQTDVPEARIPDSYLANINLGGQHTCAFYDDGKYTSVRCWGDNTYGQLNAPRILQQEYYVEEYVINGIGVGVYPPVCGSNHVCTLFTLSNSKTRAICWGNNDSGQLNIPAILDIKNNSGKYYASEEEVYADYLKQAYSIDAGGAYTCACLLNESNIPNIICWGDNSYGQTDVPSEVQGGDIQCSISAGYTHVCAEQHNKAICWGNNNHGQTDVPPEIQGHIEYINAGGYHTCASLDNGEIRCWGDNSYGQLGIYNIDSNVLGKESTTDSLTSDQKSEESSEDQKTRENPAPEISKNTGYVLAGILSVLVIGGAALFLVLKRKDPESSLKNKLEQMEGLISARDLENAKKKYVEISETYGKLPEDVKRKYTEQIVALYQKALGFA